MNGTVIEFHTMKLYGYTVSKDSLLCFVVITVILTGIFRNFDGKRYALACCGFSRPKRTRRADLGDCFSSQANAGLPFFFFSLRNFVLKNFRGRHGLASAVGLHVIFEGQITCTSTTWEH